MISILGRSMVLIALAVSVLGAFAGIAGGMKRSEQALEMVSHSGICSGFCDDGCDWLDGVCTHHT